MPREKQGYRETIADLRERGYPPVLKISEVMEITGKSRNTVLKNFKFNAMHQISLADFANQICT